MDGVISVLNKMRADGLDDVWCTETHSTSDSRAASFWFLHPNQLNDRLAVDNYNFIVNTNELHIIKPLFLKILIKFFNKNSSPKKPSLSFFSYLVFTLHSVLLQ